MKVHWNDDRGEWLRRTFTSRPDNAVVQWLTAPQGQSVNVRIALQRSAGGPRGGAGRAPSGSGSSEVQQDFNEQRLIYKCRLDPSVDNSGYAGVVRVVRNGGSARMDNGTLVIENASSVMLHTRIEWFAAFSEEKVEALREAWKGSPLIIRRCSSGTARSSRRPSTASSWISAAPPNMACLPRNFWQTRGRGTTIHPPCCRRSSRWGAIGSSSPAASIAACRPRSMPISTCKSHPVRRAICGKAWRPTSIGWRAWLRTFESTQRTSSGCAAHTIPSGQTKGSVLRSIIPAPHRPGRCGRIPTGFPPEAGVFAHSGTTTWSRGTWSSSASASCQPIKNWRCSTRIS
ncbi:MAG: glycoside hydrolase N-terminal domain-containing protein [Acidobacteriia bacterium]|nr:glycoside hydrolase N-terminal domain-containing protein [Terriglobia bacterium]